MESYFEEYHCLHMYLSVTKIIDETYRKSLNELIEIIPKIEEKMYGLDFVKAIFKHDYFVKFYLMHNSTDISEKNIALIDDNNLISWIKTFEPYLNKNYMTLQKHILHKINPKLCDDQMMIHINYMRFENNKLQKIFPIFKKICSRPLISIITSGGYIASIEYLKNQGF